MSSSKMQIVLRSSDGETFEVERAVAEQSETIKYMIEDYAVDISISLPIIMSKTLAKVIEYCKRHVIEVEQSTELKNFNAEFMKVDLETLFDLIFAVDFLRIKNLIDLCCQTAGDMIIGKTPEEIRKIILNIKNDFTLEEKEKICIIARICSEHLNK